jgi:hypothetical protein
LVEIFRNGTKRALAPFQKYVFLSHSVFVSAFVRLFSARVMFYPVLYLLVQSIMKVTFITSDHIWIHSRDSVGLQEVFVPVLCILAKKTTSLGLLRSAGKRCKLRCKTNNLLSRVYSSFVLTYCRSWPGMHEALQCRPIVSSCKSVEFRTLW